jgi:hypothetical protein
MFTVRTERGSVVAFVVVIAMIFVFCAGLVVDGARMVGAKSQAIDHAGNAARLGAQEFLSIRSGTSELKCDGQSVTVTVESRVQMTILASLGIRTKKITATQTASPTDGQ